MKKQIKTFTNKIIKIPSRMYKENELNSMGVSYVENKIFFNKSTYKKKLPIVPEEIWKNMAVLDYVDCSNESFSLNKLWEVIDRQNKSKNDFLVLPYFKDETEYDVREKIRISEELKMNSDKIIILDTSYKSTLMMKELVDNSGNFDILSIFYGIHFGHFPSFRIICEKILEFKIQTGKNVMCTAVPLMFSGDNRSDSFFMPCFNLICEAWVKNWRQGGGESKTIKCIDPKDKFRNKDYHGWLKSGYKPYDLIPQINRTVLELLGRKGSEGKTAREEYKKAIYDEVFSEIGTVSPSNVEGYVYKNFYPNYYSLIMGLYREKVILNMFRDAEEFQIYDMKDIRRVEGALREQLSPSIVIKEINLISKMVKKNKEIKVEKLVSAIETMREKGIT